MTIGIKPDHFRKHVIRPVLQRMGMWSPAAEDLLIGTAAQESGLGYRLQQMGKGPAVGVFQMEPATAKDTIFRYIDARDHREEIYETGFQIVNTADIDWKTVSIDAVTLKLQTDLAFAVATARMKYAMVPEALPQEGDIAGYAKYWKDHWNTHLGAGKVEEFIDNWYRFGLEG